MEADISFVRHLEAMLPGRSEWVEGWPRCLPGYGLVGFTGGSKSSLGTKVGVTSPEPMNDETFHLASLGSI